MCGITGFLEGDASTPGGRLTVVAERMAGMLSHRGPDAAGVWADPSAGVALGHTRLAVIDLSPLGGQPMHSACGRFTIVFNGEVYNHRELRGELEARGDRFRGHSDTEVMLAAIAAWGLEAAIRRFIGMFAFALWDHGARRLTLVRDRLGIKPLYYGRQGSVFLFGSELKALEAHPAFHAEIDRRALALFMRHNYIPAPHSIYAGIRKLPAGTRLSVARPDEAERPPEPWWDLAEVADAGRRQPFDGSADEAVLELERLLCDSVRLRMQADVPWGAFLSGGIDSSTVVALMQAEAARPVRTFTIGFHEQAYNEAAHARQIAAHLGTEHAEYYVTPAEARDVIPRLPTLYDEPFADSSQIPTFLVSQLARRDVTVALSGDGGDELFAGYLRYPIALGFWKRADRLPRWLRRTSAAALRRVARRGGLGRGRLGRKARTLADLLALATWEEAYLRLNSHWTDPAAVVIGGHAAEDQIAELVRFRKRWNAGGLQEAVVDPPSALEQMMLLDSLTYLPEDILAKVDRASMGVSLEVRVPMLDHRVVEFAWRLPVEWKLRQGEAKWILKRLLARHVPPALTERPKVGFGVPIDEWMRGPLRDWAESLLDERRLRDEGYLRPEPIREKWAAHLSGRQDWHYPLWDVLMFQSWLDARTR